MGTGETYGRLVKGDFRRHSIIKTRPQYTTNQNTKGGVNFREIRDLFPDKPT